MMVQILMNKNVFLGENVKKKYVRILIIIYMINYNQLINYNLYYKTKIGVSKTTTNKKQY